MDILIHKTAIRLWRQVSFTTREVTTTSIGSVNVPSLLTPIKQTLARFCFLLHPEQSIYIWIVTKFRSRILDRMEWILVNRYFYHQSISSACGAMSFLLFHACYNSHWCCPKEWETHFHCVQKRTLSLSKEPARALLLMLWASRYITFICVREWLHSRDLSLQLPERSNMSNSKIGCHVTGHGRTSFTIHDLAF